MTTSSHLFDANWYLTSPRTPSFLSRISPNLGFYAPMIWIVFKAGCNAMRNQYDGEAWAQSSEGIAHAPRIRGLPHRSRRGWNISVHWKALASLSATI